MTTPERLERNLPSILGDLAMGPTPEYLDDVFSRTGRMRQRPAWTFPERWLPMADITTRQAVAPRVPFRAIGVALAVLALVIAAALVYVGSHQTRLPAPFGPAANGLIPFVSGGDIYLGDPVTGQSRLLVSGPDEESGPLISRDGTQMAFARDVAGRTGTDIWVIGLDGSNPRKITTQPIDGLSWASWAPGGDRLAIIHDVAGSQGVVKTAELDMIDLGGQGLRNVAQMPGLSFVQFRPPEGDELLYRALVDGHWGLFSMRADGTAVRTVVPATVPSSMDATFANATYSADGSRVFFDEYTPDVSNGNPGCCKLFVVNADGGDLHQFVANDGTGRWDGVPATSPDGKWVAFWHNLPEIDRPQQLAVTAADGGGKVILTGPQVAGAQFIWAPDSTRILLYPDGGPSAYLVSPEGGGYTTLPWRSEDQLDWQRVAPPG